MLNKYKLIDLKNKTFGKLIVIKQAPYYVSPAGRKCVRWLVKCQCGNVFGAMSSHLIQGNITKCKSCNTNNQKCNGKMSSRAIQKVKHSAKVRNLEFNIDLNYIKNIFDKQNGICPYSGLKIGFANTIKESKRGGDSASLDRIDSSKGYIKGNVQWVHKIINTMKGRMCDKDFINWCTLVIKNQKLLS